jgi:hypothetical protein
MRWATIMILAGACATKRPTERVRAVSASSPTPPDLTGHFLVDEGETGPKRTELHRYVRHRPLVRVTSRSDLVVFDDGVAFLEEEGTGTAEAAYRRVHLSGNHLSALLKLLRKECPTLVESHTECSDSGITAVTCHLDSAEYSAHETCDGDGDDAGRHTRDVADKVLEMARPLSLSESSAQDRYTRDDIEKTLSPVVWKRYAPGSGADVQPGVAADGAAPRR